MVNENFVFQPVPPLSEITDNPFPNFPGPLGPLASLAGTWTGAGFNVIWRPFNLFPIPREGAPAHPKLDHFLELNPTRDSIKFDPISGPIPNRGLLQSDINMFGLTYLQEVSDSRLNVGLHIEPGIWAVVPSTRSPQDPPSVVRMASIPHGTAMVMQGTVALQRGAPAIAPSDTRPFLTESQPRSFPAFPESDLSAESDFRLPKTKVPGIESGMLDDPNSILRTVLERQVVLSTTTLTISTNPSIPLTGGGAVNTAFLTGADDGPNARTDSVEATLWIETIQGAQGRPNFLQLQYSQRISLVFNQLTWPHVTVGTLTKEVDLVVPPEFVNPGIAKKFAGDRG